VRLANQVNLTEAVRVALLTLPSEFSETELYERIAGISYKGDFRMVIGENPNKVKNIVDKQLPHFRRVYSHLLEDLPNVAVLENGLVQVLKKKPMESGFCATDVIEHKKTNWSSYGFDSKTKIQSFKV
jgi:hypothetical protein